MPGCGNCVPHGDFLVYLPELLFNICLYTNSLIHVFTNGKLAISITISRKVSLKRYNSSLTRLLTLNHHLHRAKPQATSVFRQIALVRSHSHSIAWWDCSHYFCTTSSHHLALGFYEAPELGGQGWGLLCSQLWEFWGTATQGLFASPSLDYLVYLVKGLGLLTLPMWAWAHCSVRLSALCGWWKQLNKCSLWGSQHYHFNLPVSPYPS